MAGWNSSPFSGSLIYRVIRKVSQGRCFSNCLFQGGEGDVRIGRRHQVAGNVFVFLLAVGVAPVEPFLEMLSCRRREFGEKESSPALVAGPNDVCVALQGHVCTRKHAAKMQVRTHGHWLGSL